MSLGNYTKCDLSANKAVIDRTALLDILRYSLYQTANNIKKTLNTDVIHNTDIDNLARDLTYTDNRFLEQQLHKLQKTAELLHTISNSVIRENFIIKD